MFLNFYSSCQGTSLSMSFFYFITLLLLYLLFLFCVIQCLLLQSTHIFTIFCLVLIYLTFSFLIFSLTKQFTNLNHFITLSTNSLRLIHLSGNSLSGLPKPSMWKSHNLRDINVSQNAITKVLRSPGILDQELDVS